MNQSPSSRHVRYEKEYAPLIDNMALDTTLRFKPADLPPRVAWFGRRAKLNRFICCVHKIDDDLVVVRIK